jgi:T5SS/PEP-CTERM-associated repeat protein
MTTETVMGRVRLFTHRAALWLAASLAIIAAPMTFAESGITNIISGNTVNVAGDYTLGNGGPVNKLIITNSGVFNVNGNSSFIGASAGAYNNTVLLTGPGSVWNNHGALIVGYFSPGNSLTIANAGRAFSAGGMIVALTVGSVIGFFSDSNTVLVSGANSVWNDSSHLTVGFFGADNTLTITNGGKVSSVGGSIANAGDRNTVLVTGTGSVWSNSSSVQVGYGFSNRLIIANGGAVFDAVGKVGGYDGRNCAVVVADSGSVWNNSSNLFVGDYGGGNSLTITNGGKVSSDGGWIGTSPRGTNTVLVTGPGSVWNNIGMLSVGSCGNSNTLTVRNGGQVFSASGFIGGDDFFGYNDAPATGNFTSVLVADAGSL